MRPASSRPVWRAFYTRPNAERRAEDRLLRQGIEAYVPARRVQKRWSDRTRWIQEPLFRGYLFARVSEAERLRTLQDEGVVRCLRLGDALAEVRPDEIALLRELAAVEERIESATRQRFPLGKRVTIAHGPLAGREGFVLDRRAATLVVHLDSVELAVRVHLRPEWLLPLPLAV